MTVDIQESSHGGTASRLRKRKIEKMARRVTEILRVTVFFVLFIVFISATWFIAYKTPYFRVKSIRVQGTERMDPNGILRLSGLNRMMSVFSVDRESVEGRIKSLPLVKKVELIEESLGRLVIKIEERVPRALLSLDGLYAEVDREGYILRVYEENIPDLPIISGISVENPSPGLWVEKSSLYEALAWLDSIPAEILRDLSELSSEGDDTSMFTMGGNRIFLGRYPENFQEKWGVIIARLEELRISGEAIEYLDARPAVPVEKIPLKNQKTGNRK